MDQKSYSTNWKKLKMLKSIDFFPGKSFKSFIKWNHFIFLLNLFIFCLVRQIHGIYFILFVNFFCCAFLCGKIKARLEVSESERQRQKREQKWVSENDKSDIE